MNRKLSAAADDFSWSRTKSNVKISAPGGNVLNTPIGQNPDRAAKKAEEDNHRKRIRVACSRCRKRKIKCSGPVGGEDQPCQNCKNAAVQTTCAFEVAGSVRVGLDQHNRPQYPYALTSQFASQLAAAGQATGQATGSYPYTLGGMLPQYQASCDYEQGMQAYDQYSTYQSTATLPQTTYSMETNLQQTTAHDSNDTFDQSRLEEWNNPYPQSAFGAYVEPLRHLQQTSCSSDRPVTRNIHQSFPAMNNLASSLPERSLPKLQYTNSSGNISALILSQDQRGSVSWPSSDSLVSRTDSVSSRQSFMDTSSIQSPQASNHHRNSQTQDVNGVATYSGINAATLVPQPAISTPVSHQELCGNSAYLQHRQDEYLAHQERRSSYIQHEQQVTNTLTDHLEPHSGFNTISQVPGSALTEYTTQREQHEPQSLHQYHYQSHQEQQRNPFLPTNQLSSRYQYTFSTPKAIAAPTAIMATGSNRLLVDQPYEQPQSQNEPAVEEQTFSHLDCSLPKTKYREFEYESRKGVRQSATKMSIAAVPDDGHRSE